MVRERTTGALVFWTSLSVLTGVGCGAILLSSSGGKDADGGVVCVAVGLFVIPLFGVFASLQSLGRSLRDRVTWWSSVPEALWGRSMPPQMLTEHARAWRRRAGAAAAESAEPPPPLPVEPAKLEAARQLLEAAQAWSEDERALARRCAADPVLMRRLYHAAARRLHPDRNGGRHLPEWTRLQQAVATLRQTPCPPDAT
jgi:hypothetical protein